jgi:hypothetical protein
MFAICMTARLLHGSSMGMSHRIAYVGVRHAGIRRLPCNAPGLGRTSQAIVISNGEIPRVNNRNR